MYVMQGPNGCPGYPFVTNTVATEITAAIVLSMVCVTVCDCRQSHSHMTIILHCCTYIERKGRMK